MIRDEKLQYNINREEANTSALLPVKIKFEYFKVEEILSPDKARVIEQAKFTYSP